MYLTSDNESSVRADRGSGDREHQSNAASPMVNGSDCGGWGNDVVEQTVTYRQLAIRVIERALKDIVAPGCSANDRETAREFLTGSAMLRHWCRVASLDPRRIIATAVMLDRRPTSAGAAKSRPPRLGYATVRVCTVEQKRG
jgi:hypothetical protein